MLSARKKTRAGKVSGRGKDWGKKEPGSDLGNSIPQREQPVQRSWNRTGPGVLKEQ